MTTIFENNTSGVVTSGGTTAPAMGTVESWTVASTQGFASAMLATQSFHVVDPVQPSEKMLVTAISGATWTVTRGDEGTATVAHLAGFAVQQVVSAGEFSVLASGVAVFNVKSQVYGATGNGLTDDTAAIQAAVTAASNAGGGTVYFPAGTYKISSAIACGGGSPGALTICGDGWSSQIKLANASNCYIFDTGSSGSAQYTPGLAIRDLYLYCNGTNQTSGSGGIFGHGSCFGSFDHLWIDTPQEAGVRLYQDGLGGYGHHNTVRACLITSQLGTITGQYGVWMSSSDENMVTGNVIQGIGNPAAQTYPTGIVDQAGLQTIADNQIVTGTGIYSGGSGGHTRIVNNICDGSYSQSGQIYAGSTGVIIADNYCYNIGYNQATNTADGIMLDNTDHLTCVGNMCLPYASTVCRSGINLSGTVTNSIVEANSIFTGGNGGSFTNTIKIGSAPTGTRISNNQGYNPVGALGPPSFPGNNVAYTNSYGVDATVFITGGTITAIAIGGTATGLTSGCFRVPAGQTITITYSGSPTWTWFGD